MDDPGCSVGDRLWSPGRSRQSRRALQESRRGRTVPEATVSGGHSEKRLDIRVEGEASVEVHVRKEGVGLLP